MFRVTLFSLFFLILSLSAETIKPKVMHGTDHYNRSTNRGSNNEPFLSTMEASVQVTSMVSLQTSSQATSNSRGRGNARIHSFLDNNRIDITNDIAKGEGEHLQTLLSMMQLQADERYLLSLQSNFESLIYLDHTEFLHKLREING